jgi:hypothetical protein
VVLFLPLSWSGDAVRCVGIGARFGGNGGGEIEAHALVQPDE